MPLKHRAGGIYIPQPSSHWTFNDSASPIVDKGGFSNLTFSGSNTFNGDSVTTASGSGAFNNTIGTYGKMANFTCFCIFKPLETTPNTDILVMSSGVGFGADDYTWYFDTNGDSSGFMLGVAPGTGLGDYGTPLGINTGGIDTTKKHYVFFGLQGSNGFISVKREGDPRVYSVSGSVPGYVTGRNFYFANSGELASGALSVQYYRAMYWEHRCLADLNIFETLCMQYAS